MGSPSCPTCGQQFPEGTAFCPQDGVALSAGPRPELPATAGNTARPPNETGPALPDVVVGSIPSAAPEPAVPEPTAPFPIAASAPPQPQSVPGSAASIPALSVQDPQAPRVAPPIANSIPTPQIQEAPKTEISGEEDLLAAHAWPADPLAGAVPARSSMTVAEGPSWAPVEPG